MPLAKFELAFATIMDIRKHMATRPDCEIPPAILCCGLTARAAWLLARIDCPAAAWPTTEKNTVYTVMQIMQ